jgi:hypothetical protein
LLIVAPVEEWLFYRVNFGELEQVWVPVLFCFVFQAVELQAEKLDSRL